MAALTPPNCGAPSSASLNSALFPATHPTSGVPCNGMAPVVSLKGLGEGAPPHGGFAFGMDRITMLLANAESLRDVIAFPKTTAQRALFEGAPTPVDPADLQELHLEVKGDEA